MPADENQVEQHAGLDHGFLSFVAFENEKELRGLLEIIGCKVDETDIVKDVKDQPAFCSCCKQEINIYNLGQVLPGSQHFYCKKRTCIMDYLERFI